MAKLYVDWDIVRDVLRRCWCSRGMHDGFRFVELRDLYKGVADEHRSTDRELAICDASFRYATDESLVTRRLVKGAPSFGMPDCVQASGLTNKGRDLLSVMESDGVMDAILSRSREEGLSLTADVIIEVGSRMLAERIGGKA